MLLPTKRGGIALSLKHLLGMVLAGMMITIFIVIYAQIANPEIFTSVYLARDTSLLTNTIQAVPFDVHYEYPTTIKERNIIISLEEVKVVRDQGESDKTFSMEKHGLFLFPTSFLVHAPYTLDAALFSIDKLGKELSFSSGVGVKYASKQALEETQVSLDALRYGVAPLAVPTAEFDKFLTLLTEELAFQDLLADSSSTDVVLLSFAADETNHITYSGVAQSKTKRVADALAFQLNNLFDTEFLTAVNSDTIGAPEVRVFLSPKLITSIESSEQNRIARFIAAQLKSEVKS